MTRFPPTTKSPNALIMWLTAPGCTASWGPFVKIIRVVATFRDKRKSVMTSSRVGKVVKSVGLGM